jgi:hypothetical protein
MKKTLVPWPGLALLTLLAAPAGAQVQSIEIDVAGYLCGL